MYNILRDIILLSLILALTDSFWIYIIKDNALNMILKIQNEKIKIKIYALILTYIVLIFSHYYFIIYRKACLLDSFMLGFFIYATYELTNLTIFNNWNPYIAIADSLWGGILFLLTYIIYIHINKYV